MYRLPLSQREALSKILNELIEAGVIRPSESNYSSPIILVPKKNRNEYRLVCDFRKLNRQIINENSYPLPRIEDITDSLVGSLIFSLFDCHSGFFSMKLREIDKHKTAIICLFGLFEFNRLPQGLKISPNYFQMLMEKALEKVINDCAKVYLDDCLVHSKIASNHINDLEKTLKCIKEANIKLRPSKCQFFKEKIEFLGKIISKNGIEISEDRIKAINLIKEPQNLKELKSFLGAVNYFKDHIKNVSTISEPLYKLTRKNKTFSFGEKEKYAFDQLKLSLCSTPILAFFDEQKLTQLHTDGSSTGVGAALIQIDKSTLKENVVCYYSRVLNNAERNYSGIEIELLAVISGIIRFKHYLLGRYFEIITDSNPLTFLMRTKNINTRLSRWALFLQDFNFEIKYRKGSSNNLCDFLSRNSLSYNEAIEGEHSENLDEIDDEAFNPLFFTESVNKNEHVEIFIFNALLNELNDIQLHQRNDSYLKHIIEILSGKTENKNKSLRRAATNYELIDGKLFRVVLIDGKFQNVLAIPKSLKTQVLSAIHDSILDGGHLGIRKTFEKAKVRFHWRSMFSDIVKWVISCPICQQSKNNRKKAGKLMPISPGKRPFSKIGLDIIGMLPRTFRGNRFILVVSCYLTKFTITKASANITATDVEKFLMNDVVLRYSALDTLISDNGVQFRSNVIKELNALLNAQHKFTTPYNPSTAGLVERTNKQIIQLIRSYVETDITNWDLVLPYITHLYNTSFIDKIHSFLFGSWLSP
ncbi:pol polyprotein-like protein [Dinothrombium tinctorium]|nr:pol polyprotein-like protein [Dinothrombium tinctorium]RWS03167.1 pol polyprotein-like protein [Dinothrombium tinctorium]